MEIVSISYNLDEPGVRKFLADETACARVDYKGGVLSFYRDSGDTEPRLSTKQRPFMPHLHVGDLCRQVLWASLSGEYNAEFVPESAP